MAYQPTFVASDNKQRIFFPSPHIRSWHGEKFKPEVRALVGINCLVRVAHAYAKDGRVRNHACPSSTYFRVTQVDGDWLCGVVEDPYYGYADDAVLCNYTCSLWFPRDSICEIPMNWDGNEAIQEQIFKYIVDDKMGSLVICPPQPSSQEKHNDYDYCRDCDKRFAEGEQTFDYARCYECFEKEKENDITCKSCCTVFVELSTCPVCGRSNGPEIQEVEEEGLSGADLRIAKFLTLAKKEKVQSTPEWQAEYEKRKAAFLRRQTPPVSKESTDLIAGLRQFIIAQIDGQLCVVALGRYALFVFDVLHMCLQFYIEGSFVHLAAFASGALIVVDESGQVHRLIDKHLQKLEHVPLVRTYMDLRSRNVWASVAADTSAFITGKSANDFVFFDRHQTSLSRASLNHHMVEIVPGYDKCERTKSPRLFWNSVDDTVVTFNDEAIQIMCRNKTTCNIADAKSCSFTVTNKLTSFIIFPREQGDATTWHYYECGGKGGDFTDNKPRCVLPPNEPAQSVALFYETETVDDDSDAVIEIPSVDLRHVFGSKWQVETNVKVCPIPNQFVFAFADESGCVTVLDCRKGSGQVTPRKYDTQPFKDWEGEFNSVTIGRHTYMITRVDEEEYKKEKEEQKKRELTSHETCVA